MRQEAIIGCENKLTISGLFKRNMQTIVFKAPLLLLKKGQKEYKSQMENHDRYDQHGIGAAH